MSRDPEYRPEYRSWRAMIDRSNPRHEAHERYSGRGIQVCQEWRTSFVRFFADMGRRPGPQYSLDRYPDNDGNYEPGNCRWATRIEQANNRRSNHRIEFAGESLTLAEWGARMGLQGQVIAARMDRHGWSAADALNTPSRRHAR